jgi:hypothetical protein
MTLSMNFSGTATDRTGGGKPDQTTVDRKGDLGVNYRPFDAVYLLATVSRIEREDVNETLQSYTANWSPFPSGALRFNFAFNQDLSTKDNAKTRSVSPSLRWNISSRAILDLSYQVLKTESLIATTENRIFNTNLQMIY